MLSFKSWSILYNLICLKHIHCWEMSVVHFFCLKKYLPTWDPLFFCGQKCINPTRFHQTCPRKTHVGPTDRFQAGICLCKTFIVFVHLITCTVFYFKINNQKLGKQNAVFCSSKVFLITKSRFSLILYANLFAFDML